MPKAQNSGASVEETFLTFWSDERAKAMETVCADKGIPSTAFRRLVEDTSLQVNHPCAKPTLMCWNRSPRYLNARKSLSGSSVSYWS